MINSTIPHRGKSVNINGFSAFAQGEHTNKANIQQTYQNVFKYKTFQQGVFLAYLISTQLPSNLFPCGQDLRFRSVLKFIMGSTSEDNECVLDIAIAECNQNFWILVHNFQLGKTSPSTRSNNQFLSTVLRGVRLKIWVLPLVCFSNLLWRI